MTHYDWIKSELGGLYGSRVVEELSEIVRLYDYYDGPGQDWTPPANLKYTPSKLRTNLVKKLIKDEARFMACRPPEMRIVPDDSVDQDACDQIEHWLGRILRAERWPSKLLKAARDCFIGKRVAIKLGGGPGAPLSIQFRPSLEFVYEVDPNDADRLSKIIFFYQVTSDETLREKQRVWRQRYWLENGRCLMDEALYDGYGRLTEAYHTQEDTGLDFIPCRVIINDGLTGDLSGESDVKEIRDNQDAYNHLKSDDLDALKFNMFPQRVFVDASQASMAEVVVAPSALIDLQTDPAAQGRQAQHGMLESGFNYDARLENVLLRIRGDMYDLLSVPNLSLDQLKGVITSGKSMRALYWSLTCRCEEKWAEWDDALGWMIESLMKMARAYGCEPLPEVAHTIKIEHLYPIPDDEEAERAADLSEVGQQARSKLNYITKWQPDADAKGELAQIQLEQRAADAYGMGLGMELGGGAGIAMAEGVAAGLGGETSGPV